MCINMYVHMYMYVYMNVYMYVYVYVYVYVCEHLQHNCERVLANSNACRDAWRKLRVTVQ